VNFDAFSDPNVMVSCRATRSRVDHDKWHCAVPGYLIDDRRDLDGHDAALDIDESPRTVRSALAHTAPIREASGDARRNETRSPSHHDG
jgi:hypothetical protein